MMSVRARAGISAVLLLSGAFAAGCGSSAPSTLAQARVGVAQASGGELERRAPTAVDQARRAVGEAEHVLMNSGDRGVAEDLAYVALRRLEQARVEARIADEVRTESSETALGGGPPAAH